MKRRFVTPNLFRGGVKARHPELVTHSVRVRKEIDCTYALAGIVQQGLSVEGFRNKFGMTGFMVTY